MLKTNTSRCTSTVKLSHRAMSQSTDVLTDSRSVLEPSSTSHRPDPSSDNTSRSVIHTFKMLIRALDRAQNTLCLKKNIPDIFDCNLNKSHPIFIIFDMNISDTTFHQMTVQFSLHPMSAPALLREIKPSKVCVRKHSQCYSS